MISLFIALILLIGMNMIFKSASQAVNGGNALNEATRNARAITPEFFEDLKNCAKDSPVFIISSDFVPQYLNKAGAVANNASPGVPPVMTVSGMSGPMAGCILNDNLHRADSLMFFARGLYKRKTANHFVVNATTTDDFLNSTTTSNEAYIHYGHLKIAADGITPVGPDDYIGAAQPYAANWVLGRNAILLVDPNSVAANATDLATPPNQELYYTNSTVASILPIPVLPAQWATAYASGGVSYYPGNLTPLGYNSGSLYPAGNVSVPIQGSRYDLAGTTIEQFRSTVTNAAIAQSVEVASEPAAGPYPNFTYWWAPLVYNNAFNSVNLTQAPYPSSYLSTPPGLFPPTPAFTAVVAPAPAPSPRFRFQASNVLSPNPMTGQDQANLAPYMLEHVSQFIVEYAGDFTTQDNAGNVIDTVPDGQVDWMYATKGDWQPGNTYQPGDWVIYSSVAGSYWMAVTPVVGSPPGNKVGEWEKEDINRKRIFPPRQIRWYGMPRDACGCGFVRSGSSIATSFVGGVRTPTGLVADTGNDVNFKAPFDNELNNVVPLADLWMTSLNNYQRPLPYEVELPGPTSNIAIGKSTAITDYAAAPVNPAGAPQPYMDSQHARYTAVWRNDVPAMVRILIKLDDPNNAIQDGPWYEYVFKLK